MKILKEKYLTEMALSRSDAIITCIGLHKKFIEHFDKIYKATLETPVNMENIPHWVTELSAFFGEIKSLKLKYNKKPLSNANIKDWFFTGGRNLEDFFKGEESKKYKKFCKELLNSNNVKNSIEKVFDLDLT